MALQKTSIQIDPEVREQLMELYPDYTISEVVRLALEYVLDARPVIVQRKTKMQVSNVYGKLAS